MYWAVLNMQPETKTKYLINRIGMTDQYFKASLDALAKNLSIALAVLFGSMIVFHLSQIENTGKMASLFIIALLLIIFLSSYLFRPQGYFITDNALIIKRSVSPVTIDRASILSAKQLNDNSLSGSIRLFGVGGLFGYFGKFSNRKLGKMTWYATHRNRNIVLVITTDQKKIIVTPDEPAAFLQVLQNKI